MFELLIVLHCPLFCVIRCYLVFNVWVVYCFMIFVIPYLKLLFGMRSMVDPVLATGSGSNGRPHRGRRFQQLQSMSSAVRLLVERPAEGPERLSAAEGPAEDPEDLPLDDARQGLHPPSMASFAHRRWSPRP